MEEGKKMKYKIGNDLIEKISAPIVCTTGDEKIEFANGAACAKAEFDKFYNVAEITIADDKIVITLEERESGNVPTYDPNESWVKQHKEEFGTEPSFF